MAAGVAWSAARRAQLIREWGGRCERRSCRRRDNLEFAHVEQTKVTGRGRGANWRVLDVIRNPSAYALLCKGCHAEFDAGYFKVRGFSSPHPERSTVAAAARIARARAEESADDGIPF